MKYTTGKYNERLNYKVRITAKADKMALPPGGAFEICFSFDTTGSMSGCINSVKGHVQDMIQRLQADIPGIRIAVFAHGDYCDRGRSYVTKHIDFCTDVAKLCKWVKNVGSTGGGDSDECYELVLHEVQDLSWTPGSQRALVMMGDACPHEPDYPDNKLKLDWRKEIETLARMGVRIYSVQCQASGDTDEFYKALAYKTGGKRLQLDQFTNMFDFIMAICYREHGAEFLDVYEKEVRARHLGTGLHKDLDAMFGALRDDKSEEMDTTTSSKAKKKPHKSVKFPSLTKTASIESLKKSLPLHSVKKPKPKERRKRMTAAERILHKTLMKSKVENLPKLRRENVPEANFMLNTLRWSPWQKIISPDKIDHSWEERRGDAQGYKRCAMFDDDTRVAGLYEFSVQTSFRGRRFVVFSKFTKGFMLGKSWERRFFTNSKIRTQINNVVSRGCCVYVRRALVKSDDTGSVKSSLRRYDYAWRRMRNERNGHRSVVKSSVQISDEKL